MINEHNLGKNPNWREADQLAIYKRRREVEHGATENIHQLAVRTGFEPATYGFQIRRSNHSATLPPQTNLPSILDLHTNSRVITYTRAELFGIRRVSRSFVCGPVSMI